uniref:Uncharacterized protein n=1 Tax=Ciona intestinalis TaxID=7719 RepID=F6X5V4_CIOIN
IVNRVRCLNFKSDGFSSQSFDKDLHSSSETKNQVKSRLFLDVVIAQCASVFKLLTSEDKTLLIWRITFFVLDLGFDVVNRVRCLNFKSDGLSSQSFDKNLHSSSKTKNQVKSRLFLDVVIAQCASVFKLLTSEDKTLLIWRITFFVLDLGFDVVNRVRCLNFKSDGLSSQSFDKNLHSSSKTKNQVKSRLFLDVVIAQCTSVFKLLTSEDKTLLIWGDSFFVLDLGFDIVNRIRCLNFKSDGFSSQSFDKDLHSSSETKNQVKSGLFLDVVIAQCASVFKLLTSEDKT